MKGYFNVLESVDLGTDINPKVAMYHEIWNKINTPWMYNKSCWEPCTEYERSILRGFKATYERTPLHPCFCLNLNSVSVENIYEASSDFEEFTKYNLKEYFDYAYPIFLEQHQPVKKKSRKTA